VTLPVFSIRKQFTQTLRNIMSIQPGSSDSAVQRLLQWRQQIDDAVYSTQSAHTPWALL